MAMRDPRIDAYIKKSQPFARPILTHLRGVVHTACPDVEESIKWGFPHFGYRGAMMCSMAAFTHHLADQAGHEAERDGRETRGCQGTGAP